jgi:hypothetical protein
MRNITPLDVWVDGEIKQATNLTLIITYDNLESDGVFEYVLSDRDNNAFVKGELAITGTDYVTWGQSTNANDDAYVFAATQLNLTLV